MAGRKVFTSGEILTAADVNSFLMDQSVMVFADSSARSSAIPSPSEGMVTYLKDEDEVQVYDGSVFTAVGPGKILQIVRETDSTLRTTTSSSFVDTGVSVTISPKSSSSTLLIVASFSLTSQNQSAFVQITDSSDTALVGAEGVRIGININENSHNSVQLIGFSAPATTSPTTYKLRFRTSGSSAILVVEEATTTFYAIEVAA